MKETILFTIVTSALLTFAPAVHAAPRGTSQKCGQIAAMCQDKTTRSLMLHELTCTTERKKETAKQLKDDPEFRTIYDQDVEPYDHNLDRS